MRWLAFLLLFMPGMAWAQPTCSPSQPSTVACFPRAVNPQPTDLVSGMQAHGPGGPNQSVGYTLQQLQGGGINLASPPPIGNVAPNMGAFSSLGVTGNTTIGGTLGVTGAAAFGGNGYVIHPYLNADGVTSDDVNLRAAVNACSAAKGSILLPPGNILLTGAAQITLSNCTIYGSGQEQYGTLGGGGTQILLTSTTVTPFIMQSGWGIFGVVFAWPNQTTGTTVYPPLMTDDGTHGAGLWWLDHVTLTNAYDGFVQTCCAWNAFFVSNSRMWAAHDLFRMSNNSDSGHLSNVHFSAGNFICGGVLCTLGINAGFANGNTLFHVVAQGGCGGCLVQVYMDNAITFGWRNFIKIDTGARMGPSMFDGGWDGIGTMVDATNGTLVGNGRLSGRGAVCGFTEVYGSPVVGTANPCFIINSTSSLTLNDFQADVFGDFIDTTGGSVKVQNSSVGVGEANNGIDYYAIKATSGSPLVTVRNTTFSGSSTAHQHGIVLTGATAPEVLVQDNKFLNLDESMNIPVAIDTIVTGNYSKGMIASPDVIFDTTSGNKVMWGNNQFELSPQPVVTSCGTGATVSQGSLAGQIAVGSPGPVTSCILTLPFSPRGLTAGNCNFTPSQNVTVSGFSTGVSGLEWDLTFSGDMATHKLNFSCLGVE
jgi:hypothetical protein